MKSVQSPPSSADTLSSWLQRTAAGCADQIAIVDGARRITYAEALGRADALARELVARHVQPGDLVAVAFPRSVEQVIAILGVVRAGAAYVPLDLAHPEERRAMVIADAAPRCIVAAPGAIAPGSVTMDVVALPDSTASAGAPLPLPAATDPAYVIYTSGSTGRPKGVVVTQHNVVRLFTSTRPLFGFQPDDVWSLFHSIAFDFSVWEMWGALLFGGRLVVVPADTARAADAFHALVVREGVTVLNQTPSAFRAFDAADAAAGRPKNALRHVVFGGEALDPRTLAGWFDAHGDSTPRLVNMYGITETTVHTTFRRMTRADAAGGGHSLVGVPLPDLRIDLLGENGEPVANGEIGEIWVGGAGVANGYLRRPELTAERFVADPKGRAGARLYRSGDLARRTGDGDLEYLGRADAQVKLRGFRIELGEIEATLRTAPGIVEAVAALRTDAGGNAGLVAWVVTAGDAAIDPRALQRHVARSLPEYMVPQAYVRIDRVPRTVNDKVDRAALPDPTIEDRPRGPGREPPRTPTEHVLADVWRELLSVPDLGRDDEFVSLGGHSLLAIRVAAAVSKRLGKEIGGLEVLETKTLAALAARVDAAPRSVVVASDDATVAAAPLTPGQLGVIVQQQLAGRAPVLNETAAVRLRGRIDDDAFAAALAATLQAHPAFGSRVVERSGQWWIERVADAVIPIERLAMPNATDAEVQRRLVQAAAAPFDLERGPLARAVLVRTAPDVCTLLLVAHHVVVDEWSYHLVLEELGARLRGTVVTPNDPGPFAHAQRRQSGDRAAAAAQRDHWRRELEGATLEIELPPPAVQGNDAHAGDVVDVVVPSAATAVIRSGLESQGATEFEVGLAAVAAVMEHEAHRPDVVTLVTFADRDRPAVADVVGYLLDVLPVRIRLAENASLRDVVARTRTVIAATASRRALPVGETVGAAGLTIAPSDHGIGALFYTRQEGTAARLTIPGVRVEQQFVHAGAAKFDASIYLVSEPDTLRVRVEYRHRSLDRATARRIADRVARALAVFANAPDTKLEALDLLGPEERSAALAAASGPAGPATTMPVIPAVVAAAAARAPRAVAIVEDGRTVHFDELLAAADRLAHTLRKLGVGPGDVVPVLGHRSAATIASWLGVQRAGAAYAPVEADQPPSRRAAMIEDCRSRVVVAEPSFRDGMPPGLQILPLADVGARDVAPLPPMPLPTPALDDLAYVVFTSGSTGRPKAIEIQHGALCHIVAWHWRQLALTPADRVPLLSGLGFDATVLETWATLSIGARLELPTEEVRLDPKALRDWMVARGITVAFAPTVLAESLLGLPWPANGSLRMLQTGGEALRSRPPGDLPFPLVNLYGPAECAVWVTSHRVASIGTAMPAIGTPLDDIRAYVVDHRGRLCAPPTLGELWLAGPQTGRGYRGLPERTASSFPTVTIEAGRTERVYRTGDLVRSDASGVIAFVGRRDMQVKLRGVRIEIGEIEAALLCHPDVKGCAVALRGTPAMPYLGGYVEPRDPQRPPSEKSLADHVGERVPRGMVPTRWSIVDALARTTNGKVDRKVLPEIAASREVVSDTPDTALQNDVEHTIARIWTEVLGVPVTTRDADLFRLGGSSLSAVRIVTMIGRELAPIPVRAVLQAPTVQGLAAAVAAHRARNQNGSVPVAAPVVAPTNAAATASSTASTAAPAVAPVAAAPVVVPEPVQQHSAAFVRLRDGHGEPLFCMPGIGGHAFQYRSLVQHLRTNRPVLGMQLYDLEVAPTTFESIEATAAAVVTEVKKERPRGPYSLMGYSFGGLLALEIARQLVANGDAVSFVGLFDAYAPGTTAPEGLMGKLRQHAANLVGSNSVREIASYVGTRLRSRARRFLFRTREITGADDKVATGLEQRIEEMSVRCLRAMNEHPAKPFAGRMTVFRAARLMDWTRVDDPTKTCGWAPFCTDLEVVDIDCKHLDMFREENMRGLANRLDDVLEAAQRRTESGGTNA